MIDAKLLEIIACPKCKAKVSYNAEKTGLCCHQCRLEYPIHDDIPVMLVDEAKAIEESPDHGGK